MSSGEKIIRSLQGQKELKRQLEFGFVPPRPERPYVIDWAEGHVKLRLRVEDFDRLGVLLTDMQFELSGPESDSERFRRHIELLSQGNGPGSIGLRLIEKDDESLEALLRSDPTDSVDRRYFEMTMSCGTVASLRHFTVDAGNRKRTQTSVNMSMESFVLLVDQLFVLFKSQG